MSMTNFQMITIKIERVANFEVFQFRRCWCWRSGYFLPLKATTSQSPPKSRREPWRVPRSKTGSWTQRLQTGGSWTQRLQNKKHTFCPVHNISVGFLSSVFKISAGFQTFSRQTDSHVQINRTSIFTQHTVCWKFYTHVKVNSDERKKMELTIFRRKIRYKYKLEWKISKHECFDSHKSRYYFNVYLIHFVHLEASELHIWSLCLQSRMTSLAMCCRSLNEFLQLAMPFTVVKLGGLDLDISLGNGGGFYPHITPTLPFEVQTYQYFHQNLFAFSYLSIISIMNS